MSSVGHWRRDAARTLHAARPHEPAALEAELLLGRALGVSRTWLYAHADEPLAAAARHRADTLLARRLDGEPIAYLLGSKEFRSRDFRVTPDVLIPRDDTEILVEVALRQAADLHASLDPSRPLTVLDAGSGSGIVAVTLALELSVPAHVIGLERSAAALEIARGNAQRCGARVSWMIGDWLSSLRAGSVDLLVSNPPYVESQDPHLDALSHEPRQALAAGADGMDDLLRLIGQLQRVLAPQARVAMEHGHRQGPAVRQALRDVGLQDVATALDLGHRERVSSATQPGRRDPAPDGAG